jgi:hypothetical protein
VPWSRRRDNPALSDELRAEIERLKATDQDEYEHVYEDMCRQAVTGSVYKNELLAADKEGRICRVPYDASKSVDTFWDLGYFDNVAIWLAQSVRFEFSFIDFFQGEPAEPSVLPTRASVPPLRLRY